MLTLIAYDIPDDKRRLRIAKCLEDFGDRVQYSVFEAILNAGEIAELHARLEPLIHPDEDSIRIYPLCQACRKQQLLLGNAEAAGLEDCYVL